MSDGIKIRSENEDAAEISWFAPLCDGDDAFLGERSDYYKSTWDNTSRIVLRADKLGYRNILLPSSYQVGQDTMTFASAIAPLTQNINLLTAVRCGELHPPMLARAVATLDHILRGRLTINIISSDLPGLHQSSELRYRRSGEVIEFLKQAWTQDHIEFNGEFYQFDLPASPVKPYQQNGGPLLYFGGYSELGQDLCARHCDVYLMWPETRNKLCALMETMTHKAAVYNRTIDFGLRIHIVVRESESAAREAAKQLMSRLDPALGEGIRNRAQDAQSKGVSRQSQLREEADNDGFVEPHLWTGIGRARSGCGAALVGDPDQIVSEIKDYMKLGIRAFIFSGYPHLDACELFGQSVLPQLKTCSLPHVQGRVPASVPSTPLGTGKRV